MGRNIFKRTGRNTKRALANFLGIFTGRNRKKSKKVTRTAREQISQIKNLRENFSLKEKELNKLKGLTETGNAKKKDGEFDTNSKGIFQFGSENKITKEGKNVLSEKSVPRSNEENVINKIKGLKTGVSKDGTITIAGKKEVFVIKGNKGTWINSGIKTELKPNEMVLPTDHGIYSLQLRDEALAQAKKFGIDIRDIEGVKKKAKMLGYDLDNPKKFQEAVQFAGKFQIGGPQKITGEIIDKIYETSKLSQKNISNSGNSEQTQNKIVSTEKERAEEIEEKRDFNQFMRTSYADKLSVFHNQTKFGTAPLMAAAAGAQETKLALGTFVQNRMDGVLGKVTDLKNTDLAKLLEALKGAGGANVASENKNGRNL